MIAHEDDVRTAVDAVAAETGFSGVVRVDIAGEMTLHSAYGLADRAHGIPNTVETRFGMASGCKVFTAPAVMSLVDDGVAAAGHAGARHPERRPATRSTTR